jgi:hypothetical protein
VLLDVGAVGPFSFVYDVTTNATAPFTLSITGETVEPNLGFFASDLSPAPEVRMITRNASGLVLLWNTGNVGVVLGDVTASSSAFGLHTNCSGVLQPGDSCDLILSVVLSSVKTGKERGNVTVDASGRQLALPVEVLLLEDELHALKRSRARRAWAIGAFFSAAAIGPRVFVQVRKWYRRPRKVASVVDEPPQTVVFASGGTQVGGAARTGGVWSSTELSAQVTPEALADMATLIANLA